MQNKEIDEIILDFSRVYILTLLYQSPAHGYEIINKFRQTIGKDVSPSLVYPFLKQLELKDIVKHTIKPVGEKKKKIFELTPYGKNFSEKLFKRFSKLISVALEPSLEVCAHCGCKIYQSGHKEKIGDKLLIFCCCYCATSYKESL